MVRITEAEARAQWDVALQQHTWETKRLRLAMFDYRI
jgi:hypothetical protein